MNNRLLQLKPKAFLCPFCCTWHNLSEEESKPLGQGRHQFKCDIRGVVDALTPYYLKTYKCKTIHFGFYYNKCSCWSDNIVCMENDESYIRTQEIPLEDFTPVHIRNTNTIGYVASFILPYGKYVEQMRGFPASTEYMPYVYLPHFDKKSCRFFCKNLGIFGKWVYCRRSNFCKTEANNNRIVIGFAFDKTEHDNLLNYK